MLLYITCALVKAFYEDWAGNREADTALRSAQIKMLKMVFIMISWLATAL